MSAGIDRVTFATIGSGNVSIIDRTSRYCFEPSSPFQQFRRTGDEAIGPGERYEGGDVVMVYALKALKEAGCSIRERHRGVDR